MATALHVCFEPSEKRRKLSDVLSVDRSGVYRQIVQESGEEVSSLTPSVDRSGVYRQIVQERGEEVSSLTPSVDRSGVYRQIVQESGDEEFGIPDFRPPTDLDRLWPVTTTIEEKRQFDGPTHLAYPSPSVLHFVYGPPELIHKIPGMENAPKRQLELDLHMLIPQG